MQPALRRLEALGPSMGLASACRLFQVTGTLSSILDSAPTNLTFFTVARSLSGPLPVAIRLGAVFMGADTRVGSGPNFLVKSLSDERGFAIPSFFGSLA
jgi:Na+/H+ antiporter NhaD/arsenite permease-like protein